MKLLAPFYQTPDDYETSKKIYCKGREWQVVKRTPMNKDTYEKIPLLNEYTWNCNYNLD